MLKPATPDAFRLFAEGSQVLTQMTQNGMRIDTVYLSSAIADMQKRIVETDVKMKEDETYKLWRKEYGGKSNFGSGEQLAHILYDCLEYECENFTEKGKRSVTKGTLASIDLPFLAMRTKLEEDKGALRTLQGIDKEVVNGLMHPDFNLNTVITFRSSSSSPNSQNFPMRNPEYAQIVRRCFIARKGNRHTEFDFKQIEVGTGVCEHKDPTLRSYVCDPKSDMHRDTAAELFFLKKDQVEKRTHRDVAKNQFVFPQFYGSVYFQCAPPIWELMERRKYMVGDISLRKHLRQNDIRKLGNCEAGGETEPGTFVHHLRKVQDNFWKKRFPVYAAWKNQRWEEYKRDGGFNYLTGFRSEGIYSRNDVSNHPIQGAAFHLDLLTAIRMSSKIKKRRMKTLLIGEIHDSFLADVPENELDDLIEMAERIVKDELPVKYKWINVPMKIEVESAAVGQSWAEKKPYELHK